MKILTFVAVPWSFRTYYKTTYSESESAGIRKAFWSGLGRAVPARVFKSVGMAA